MGKLKAEALRRILKNTEKTSRVIVPPSPGFDSGVHELDDRRCMVISTDPCLGGPKGWFGWLLINYAASDVAIFGAKPQFCTINLLAPDEKSRNQFSIIMKQASTAAKNLGMTIITGHTGTYSELSTMIGVCTAYGFVDRDMLVTPAGAKPGHYLICTKPLGLETLINFSLTQRELAIELFGRKRTLEFTKQIDVQTCVKEALLLSRSGLVEAMHDATEGGLVAALNEMADASNLGFSISFDKLPILPELKKLSGHFDLGRNEILSISSTGTILAAVSSKHLKDAVNSLSTLGLNSTVIGMFSKSKERVIKSNDRTIKFPYSVEDPYDKIMQELG